jgi:hypothetical protein
MAAVGGVAYMGAKAGSNRAQANAAEAQAQPATAAPAPPPPAPVSAAAPPTDTISRLQQLAALHDSGALTDDEFSAAKAQVLA